MALGYQVSVIVRHDSTCLCATFFFSDVAVAIVRFSRLRYNGVGVAESCARLEAASVTRSYDAQKEQDPIQQNGQLVQERETRKMYSVCAGSIMCEAG